MNTKRDIIVYIADCEEDFEGDFYVAFEFFKDEKEKMESLINISKERGKFIRIDEQPKLESEVNEDV